MPSNISSSRPVAVIGAGPAGLAAARWLKRHGLTPHVFEAADGIGGQWNAHNPASATWSGMRTNTSRTLSRFSDRSHDDTTALFPTREQMLAYLEGYARQFELCDSIHLATRVERISRQGQSWLIDWRGRNTTGSESFSAVIVATGAEGAPIIPAIPGLRQFSGALGALHSSRYKGAQFLHGRNVVVVGGSISALEIASDLALAGAANVTVASRRQRYILPKMIAGTPADHMLFTRMAALSEAALTPDELGARMKAAILAAAGNPANYGAPEPDPDLFRAGITQAQHYLSCIAEGRISTRPAIDKIDGTTVHFTDGSSTEADAIIFATGFTPALDFLPPTIAQHLAIEDGGPDLFAHSFHPEAPNMAFIGLYNLVGPKLPVIDLQARWIAAIMGGAQPLPSVAEMRRGIEEGRWRRLAGIQPVMHGLAIDFARRHGVDPDPRRWPALARALIFGPLSPIAFRLEGPDRLPNAADVFAAETAQINDANAPELTAEERATCIAVGLDMSVTAPAGDIKSLEAVR